MSTINPQHSLHKPVEIIAVSSSGDAKSNTEANTYVEPQVASSALVNTDEAGKFMTNDLSPAAVKAARNRIINMIKNTRLRFDIATGINIESYRGIDIESYNDAPEVTPGTNRYPIVCLINGVGGIGKDTFIEAVGKVLSVYNMSSVDPVKEAAEVLIHRTALFDQNEAVNASKHRDDKDDQYRAFLHDLKVAWIKFCDGPATAMSGELTQLITTQLNGGESYDIVFMHIREPEELEKLQNRIMNDLGLVCLTILVKGWIDPNSFSNEGDQHVEDFDYDFVIINQYNQLNIFELQATYFAKLLEKANDVYGLATNIDDASSSISYNDVNKIKIKTDTSTKAYDHITDARKLYPTGISTSSASFNSAISGTQMTSPEFV